MKLHALLCLAWLTVAAGRAGAQASDTPAPRPTLPPGPVLSATPDFAAWTIVLQTVPGLRGQSAEAVTRSAASSAPPDSLTSITKTGQVRRSVRKLKTGQQEEIWYEHGNRLTMESGWKIPMFEVAAAPAGQPLGLDFPELAWVAAGNFVGTQTYQKVDYLVFELQVPDANTEIAKARGFATNDKPATTLNRAYIHPETRLPWLLQTGDVLHRYVFQAAPTAPLEVPTAFQAMFDTFEKGRSEPVRRPVAP